MDSEFKQYTDFIQNAKKFAETAMLNELSSICESYKELTGVSVENIEIEFTNVDVFGNRTTRKVLSGVKIINERI